MDLLRHHSTEFLSVRSINAEGIQIGEDCYQQSLLLTDSKITLLPQIHSLADICNELIESALADGPDVVLIGTGATLLRPSRNQYLDWLNAQVGIETMDTRAASRTFNILVSEDRPVAAILIPITSR